MVRCISSIAPEVRRRYGIPERAAGGGGGASAGADEVEAWEVV